MDIQETLGHSRIQHGSFSDRIYLMHLDERDFPRIVSRLDELAREKRYGKIFAKVSLSVLDGFLSSGYSKEACVKNFFCGKEDAFFLAKYFDSERQREQFPNEIEKNLSLAKEKAKSVPRVEKHAGSTQVIECSSEHVEAMAQLYQAVFPTYPFPIDDPKYLKETMASHVRYFAVENQGDLWALASAEQDSKNQNVEMTDFATHPKQRGKGWALSLLTTMEDAMRKKGFRTAYTIARALSPGMNITFSRSGYFFGGTLTNNTQISGRIESMNVWYKAL